MLGLAGYDKAYFDDFRVEVIEEDDGRQEKSSQTPENIAQRPRSRTSTSPRLPAPTLPAAASLPTDARPR